MKKLLIFLCAICLISSVVKASTETINWYVDGSTYATTTCQTGNDIILPTAPTKYGYTFQGWIRNYIPIEYLESTGTQYIDTGFRPNDATRIIVKYEVVRANNNSTPCVSSWLTNCNGVGITGSTTSGLSVYFLGMHILQPITINTIYEVELNAYRNNKYAIINGVSYSLSIDPSCRNTQITSPSMTISKNASNKLYYFKIYDNDTLVRDLIPVIDSSGIPCMYDKVTKQFFYNSGTGDFIAGPVLNE